jgi:hypothetical protein
MSAATYSFPIVILGGAYCARALSAGLGQAVALVADQNVMLVHPMLAEVSGSSISPLHVVNPLRRFCRGAAVAKSPPVSRGAALVQLASLPPSPSAVLSLQNPERLAPSTTVILNC